MAAGPWLFYDEGLEDVLDGTVDLDSDTVQCRLHDAAYTPSDADTSASNELSTANGYTAGGVTCTIVVAQTGGVVTVDSTTNPSWAASGSGISAATAVIRTSANSQPLLRSVLNSGSNITAASGNNFDITMHASGLFTATQP